MKYLIIIYLILGIYLVEHHKMFPFFGCPKNSAGYIACHVFVALMMAGTLYFLYQKSGYLFFVLKDSFLLLFILACFGLFISVSSVLLILFKDKKFPKKIK